MKPILVVVLCGLVLFVACMTPMMVRQRRMDYVAAHPDLDQRTKTAILGGKIFIGMTREQTRASWGKPTDINRSVYSWGTHEQWVYRRGEFYGGTVYVYFEDDKLTSWSD